MLVFYNQLVVFSVNSFGGMLLYTELNMNGNSISNMNSPTYASDGATKGYVDNSISNITSTNLNVNSNQINNVANPTSASDAATKEYVDSKFYTLLGVTRFAGSSILNPSIMSTI